MKGYLSIIEAVLFYHKHLLMIASLVLVIILGPDGPPMS